METMLLFWEFRVLSLGSGWELVLSHLDRLVKPPPGFRV